MAVLRDWSEDGRVARSYAPPCYEEAIDALPPDIRDYTNAEDVITRALASAVRAGDERDGAGSAQRGGLVAEPAAHDVPLVLWGITGLALVLVVAGLAAYGARRRRDG